jgi:valyl-tRNA synthetase
MRGKKVFYPIGWDDNGLATERRVQNYFHVRCDPALPYDPAFVPPASPNGEQVAISRRSFVELCHRLTDLDEQAFEEVWRRLGLSVDWSTMYRTIDDGSRAISQRAFLRNLARGEAYLAEAPSLWDVTFQTAVAQAEVEDREVAGATHRIAFHRPDGQAVPVITTRPELLPACVAVVAHPGDERYAGLIGTTVTTPLFGVEVPVLAHHLADPAKGTGIAMVCTFGDSLDVTWWRDLRLPARPVMGRDGKLLASPPAAITSRAGRAAYRQLAGETALTARKRIAGMLSVAGDLLGGPDPVRHSVNFYEKGTQPLEIVTTRQWYIRNGAYDEDLRAALLARGEQIDWHPPFMQVRYQNWVNGLAGDWLISRQRFFGVPVPVWYPLDDEGRPRYDAPIIPADDALPVDPAADTPPGYTPGQRGQPGGFAGDPDVMDTWATSSLTPQLAARWTLDGDLFARVYPMDLRPQAHEIIRTWLFYTVLRAQTESGTLPWRHAAISGWVLDPDRKKMSKSVGNVVTPMDPLRQYGSDAVRYWAANGRLGADVTFDPAQLRVGRRLAIKILNASRFILRVSGDGVLTPLSGAPPARRRAAVPGNLMSWAEEGGSLGGGVTDENAARGSLGAASPAVPSSDALRLAAPDPARGDPGDGGREAVSEPLDAAMLERLAGVIGQCTRALDGYDHTGALAAAEEFFWFFCDDYLELVKDRAYGERGEEAGRSARTALRLALSVILRLFAPFLPYVTEEVWSWWQDGSVHTAAWPAPGEVAPEQPAAAPATPPAALSAASGAIAAIRGAKSGARVSMRTPVRALVVTARQDHLDAVLAVLADVQAAGRVVHTELRRSDTEPAYQVTL